MYNTASWHTFAIRMMIDGKAIGKRISRLCQRGFMRFFLPLLRIESLRGLLGRLQHGLRRAPGFQPRARRGLGELGLGVGLWSERDRQPCVAESGLNSPANLPSCGSSRLSWITGVSLTW